MTSVYPRYYKNNKFSYKKGKVLKINFFPRIIKDQTIA